MKRKSLLGFFSLFSIAISIAILGSACTKKGSIANTKLVELKTSEGIIVLELNAEKAPKTVDNFLQYVTSGFYDGTIFHRVIDGFVIQGGGFTAEMMQKKTNPPIVNEAKNGLSNASMTISMARTNDPNSATAQFFINLKDNKMLDFQSDRQPGYAVFGRVIEGKEVVEKIAKVATGDVGGHGDVPLKPIVIEKATVR